MFNNSYYFLLFIEKIKDQEKRFHTRVEKKIRHLSLPRVNIFVHLLNNCFPLYERQVTYSDALKFKDCYNNKKQNNKYLMK